MKGNVMLYLVSPPMTLLCKEVPDFKAFKYADWIHAVTLTGKQVYIAKRNISLVEEVSDEKMEKVKAESQARKIVMPNRTIPGSRLS